MQGTTTAQVLVRLPLDFSAQVAALNTSRAMAVTRLAKQRSYNELERQVVSSVNDTKGSSDERMPTSSETVAEPVPSPPNRPRRTPKMREHSSKPKKPKIRTYAWRKTEIEELTAEIQYLKRQMADHDYRAEVVRKREALVQRELSNQALRDALRAQSLSFASAVSMLSQIFREKVTGPFDLPTRLGRNPYERDAALLRMKRDRLPLARLFMLQRQHFLSTAEFCDRKRFTATNGDMVSMHFEIIPLPEAHSVKAIFDALQSFVYNIEISISDAVGDITVRENDDAKPGSPVTQHRLNTMIQNVVQIEANNVAFAAYHPANQSGHELGVLVCDAVDEDELFPYRPLGRTRQDMTMIIQLETREEESGNPTVVLSWWWCLRVRKSDSIYIPPFAVERVLSSVDQVAAAMLSTARRANTAAH